MIFLELFEGDFEASPALDSDYDAVHLALVTSCMQGLRPLKRGAPALYQAILCLMAVLDGNE